MLSTSPWPEWVIQQVLPKVSGRVRGIQSGGERTVLVFTEDRVVLAEKTAFKGVQVRELPYPPGLLLNGSRCPHCNRIVLEPVGKVARLKEGPVKMGSDEVTDKPRAGRPYGSQMPALRHRAKTSGGAKGPIRSRRSGRKPRKGSGPTDA